MQVGLLSRVAAVLRRAGLAGFCFNVALAFYAGRKLATCSSPLEREMRLCAITVQGRKVPQGTAQEMPLLPKNLIFSRPRPGSSAHPTSRFPLPLHPRI